MNPTFFTFRNRQQKKLRVSILHEDEHLLVIDKPAGVPVIADRWDLMLPNLRDLLNKHYGSPSDKEAPGVWVVHRLDADTSGVMVFARSAEMHRALNEMFMARQVHKTYQAVVTGAPTTPAGEIDLPLRPHSGRKHYMKVSKKGQPALTKYEVVESFRHYSLLSVSPVTGRRHQIRAHLRAIGCPLTVDPLYGKLKAFDLSMIKPGYIQKKVSDNEHHLISRLTLHSFRIRFRHPLSGEELAFETAAPKDFQAVLKALRKWDHI